MYCEYCNDSELKLYCCYCEAYSEITKIYIISSKKDGNIIGYIDEECAYAYAVREKLKFNKSSKYN